MTQDLYWAARKDMLYYKEVLRLARRYAPHALSVIDVGSMNSPFICQFGWIPSKTSLDLYRQGDQPRVISIQADFLKWNPGRRYDLVLCLQVLEHLDNPEDFCRRLLVCGRTVIISVPYRWPQGLDPHHVQDPVDERKLRGWLGRSWDKRSVIRDGDRKRMIVVVVT